MRVHDGGADFLVTEQFLDCPDVVTGLKEAISAWPALFALPRPFQYSDTNLGSLAHKGVADYDNCNGFPFR